ncbi:MAG: cation-translocating P-type ATPase [Candidatus Pacebacteria bacterium]|nr:cation-translocating P-type ATPase [Candidatus Paceibacterota bacterium]
MEQNKKRHHKDSVFLLASRPVYFWLDFILIILCVVTLIIDVFNLAVGSLDIFLLIVVANLGVLPVLWSALKALRRAKATIDLLASIALIFALLAAEWRSAVFIGLMLASARLFARYTEGRAKKSIQGLLKLRPAKAHILVDGQPREVGIEDIKVDDLVLVESGERVAIDGIVESGEADIDQSSLTGESEPVTKRIGEDVFSSTLNISGSLVVRTTKVGNDTTFAKIMELVEKSQASKTPILSITEHFTKWYIILTLVGSAVIYYFSGSLNFTLAVLLVTCADDIAVAIPLAFTAAIGSAAKRGVIVKGGMFLEGLNKAKTIVFDKTGTLTVGRMTVARANVFNGQPLEKFLGFLGALESESSQPVAKAIYSWVKQKQDHLPMAEQAHEEPGKGIMAYIAGDKIIVGRPSFLEETGVKFSEDDLRIIDSERAKNLTVIVLSVNQKPMGFVSLANNVRPSARHIVERLKKIGFEKMIMLTGDNERVAGLVAREVGIDEFKADFMPKDKTDYLGALINSKNKVVMVGDGVNDAATLALADIGIAMGGIGSDAAIEAADIILMKDNLNKILETISLSRQTMKIVYQNIFLWVLVNVVGLILVFAKVLGPQGAAAYNFLTDFLPLFNSLRLFGFRYKNHQPAPVHKF